MKMFKLVCIITILFVADIAIFPQLKSNSALATPGTTYFGFTPFPYDFTIEALEKTYSIVIPNSTIIGFHLDDGIPWGEALENQAFPNKIQNEWDGSAQHIVPGKVVYLGLAPLEKDRVNIVHSNGDSAGAWVNVHLNDLKVKNAYLNYARRAVQKFKPEFLNLGIEVGELALRKPDKWPSFVELYDFVRIALKQEFPNLKIGISFGLQSLMNPKAANLAKPLIESSDYLCLSFYPNMSVFGEKFGAPALSPGRLSWLEPLKWVRNYTDKPIAICETGYSTKPVDVESYGLHFPGDPTTQADYLQDLIDIARKDNYLFVIWFLAIDYDKLYAKMPDPSGVNKMWLNIGFFDGDVRPKPAWAVWQSGVVGGKSPNVTQDIPEVTKASKNIQPAFATPNPQQNNQLIVNLLFENLADLAVCTPSDKVTVDDKLKQLSWQVNYRPGEWNWCAKSIPLGQVSKASHIKIKFRAEGASPIFVKIEETSKEAFYALINSNGDWQEIDIKLSELKLDEATRKNSTLDTGDMDKIILADPGGINGLTGSRNVLIKNIEFY